MSPRRKWTRIYRWVWLPLIVPAVLFLGKEAYSGWLAPRMPWTAPQPTATPPIPDPVAQPSRTEPKPQSDRRPAVADRAPTVVDD